MSIDPILGVAGTACVLMGIVSVWAGDKELSPQGMFSARTPKQPGMKWLKWLIGLALVGAGAKLVSLALV